MRVAGPRRDWGRRLVVGLPFLWLALFFLVPLLIVGKISLSETRSAIPPYEPLFEFADGTLVAIRASVTNFKLLFEDDLYVSAYFQSLTIAGISTLICLLIGYPMALGIIVSVCALLFLRFRRMGWL